MFFLTCQLSLPPWSLSSFCHLLHLICHHFSSRYHRFRLECNNILTGSLFCFVVFLLPILLPSLQSFLIGITLPKVCLQHRTHIFFCASSGQSILLPQVFPTRHSDTYLYWWTCQAFLVLCILANPVSLPGNHILPLATTETQLKHPLI